MLVVVVVVVAEPDAVVVLVAAIVMAGDVGVWGWCCCFRGREMGGSDMVIVETSFFPVVVETSGVMVVVETGMLRPFDTTLNPLLREPVSCTAAVMSSRSSCSWS